MLVNDQISDASQISQQGANDRAFMDRESTGDFDSILVIPQLVDEHHECFCESVFEFSAGFQSVQQLPFPYIADGGLTRQLWGVGN